MKEIWIPRYYTRKICRRMSVLKVMTAIIWRID